jgi:hypothetical protein
MAYNKVATAPDGVPVYQDEGGKYYTQNADQSYTQQFQGGAPDWLKPQGGQQGGAFNLNSWADQQLKGANSTDDPNYWYGKLASDPKAAAGDQSALGYWADRIARGNGAAAVKNGTMSLFNDTPGGTPGQTSAFGDGFGIVNGGGTNTPTNPNANAQQDALYQQLLARSKQGLDVSASDPALKGQIDANNAQTDRASRNYLADLAEKAGPLANLQGEQRLTAEQAGQSEGAFAAGLVGNEINARRTEIQNALTQMGSQLSDQQKNQLTAQLAQLDAASKKYAVDAQSATSKYGIDANSGLGYAQLGNNANQFAANLQNQKDQFGLTQTANKDESNQVSNRLLLTLMAQYGLDPSMLNGA